MKYDVISDIYHNIPHKIRDHAINKGKYQEMAKITKEFEEFAKRAIKDIRFIPDNKLSLEEDSIWKESAYSTNNEKDTICMDENHMVLSNKNKQIYVEHYPEQMIIYLLINTIDGCYIERITHNKKGKTISKKEYYDMETIEFLKDKCKILNNDNIRANLSALIKEKTKELYILPDEESIDEMDIIDCLEIAKYLNNAYLNEEEYTNSFFQQKEQAKQYKKTIQL